jgi:quinol monooxygenase YgiN
MPYYAVAERRVRPGRMADFVEATRLVGEHFAHRRFAQGQFNLYVDERNADTALLVGSWPDPDHFEAAHADIPAHLLGALEDAANPASPRTWRWYRPMREVMTFSHRPTVVVALRFCVAPAEQAKFEKWARSMQDAAAELPGVVATRVLLARDEPGDALYLGEYRDASVDAEIARLTERMRPPVELRDRRRFLGHVGYSWERPETRA